MSDNLAPKVFQAEGSKKKNPLVVVLLSVFCIAVAVAAYYLGMPAPKPAKQVNTVTPLPPSIPADTSAPTPTAPAAKAETPKAAEGENSNARLSFRFDYLNQPAQWREWRRISGTQWEEVESSGQVTRFTVVGRLAEPDMVGTIVRRVSDLKMDVLIPDKQSTRKMYWRNVPDGKWVYMGQVSAEAALPTAKDIDF